LGPDQGASGKDGAKQGEILVQKRGFSMHGLGSGLKARLRREGFVARAHIAIKAGDQETVKCHGAKSLILAQHFNALLGELFTICMKSLVAVERPARMSRSTRAIAQ
jgi:hypothetical protein